MPDLSFLQSLETRPPVVAGGLSPRDLQNLVTLAKRGDEAAFTDLVTSQHRAVFRWALTFARDGDEADEITQETFVMVHRKLSQFRGDSPVEGWIYGITRSIALQRRRRVKRRALLSGSRMPGVVTVYNTDPGARVDRERFMAYVRHFFVELPPRQREVFDLVDLQGHDPSEVAELIGIKAATVRGNLFKARASLRAQLIAANPAWKEADR